MSALFTKICYGEIMKKIFLSILFILFFYTNTLASEFTLFDVRIGSKVTDYLSSNEISKYYQDNMEKNAKGESAWGKDYKYSTVSFYGSKVNDDHDIIQIYYENNNDKIVATSGMITDLKFNQCIELRNNKVSEHVAKKLLLNFKKEKDTHTFPDGMKDYFVLFRGINTDIGFRCYAYEDGHVVYRYSDIELNYNDWLFEFFNKKE